MNFINSSVTKAVGGNVVRNAVNDARSRLPGGTINPNIKWENYNYPPLLKLIHYDLSELEDPVTRSLVRKLNLTFVLVFIVSIINFINSIAQTASGHNGLRILYSVLNFFIFVPIALYGFYKGYRGITYTRRELRFYWVVAFIEVVAFMVFSIISGGNYNGWTRVAFLFGEGDVFQGILAIIESLIYLGNCLLVAFCAYRIREFSLNAPPEDRL